MDYETEEQQLEAIKKWWQENSMMIVTGIVAGVGAIFGWQYYQQYTISHSEQASVIYEQVISTAQKPAEMLGDLNEQQTRVNQLAADYSDTPYAALSALILAKQHIIAGESVKAQQQLQWVIDHGKQPELVNLAKIRLSKVHLSNAQTDQALLILNETFPDSFHAMVLELKGDALLIKGKPEEARAAYMQAMALAGASARWLQLKLDDIGDVIQPDLTKSDEPSA